MRNLILKSLLITLVVVLLALSAEKAFARVFIGGGVVLGAPYYAYPPYYAYYPPYYPAYPGYPAPYPAPYPYPPAYGAAPAPYPLPAPTAHDRYYTEDGENCREYRHTVVIDGQKERAFGHACRGPDGSWRIVD